ncbi:MAG: DUF2207 domain-containing protein [Candidatus Anstonellales archaeon]
MKKLILFFVFLLITATASSKYYLLDGADLTYTINNDGTVHVTERITYELNGCFKELYLEKPTDLIITNARGYCENAKCTFRIDEPSVSISGYRELILSLDSGGCDNRVTAVFDYDIYAIKIYKDTAQFYYKLWGDHWDSPTPLIATINLPGPTAQTKYFVHSFSDYGVDSAGSSIQISAYQPANQYLEINLLMPLEWFEDRESSIYYHDYKHSKSDILKIEEQQMNEQKFWKSIACFVFFFSILLVLVPFFTFPLLYYFFGTEYSPEQVGYSGEYEREPPSPNPPAEAPFFIEAQFSSASLPATIMHLIYKGYLDIIEDKTKNDILLVPGKGKGELKEYEKSLLDYMLSKMENKKLSMKKFRDSVTSSYAFYAWFEKWKSNVERTVDIEKYAEYKGYNIAKWVFGTFILIDIVIFFISTFVLSSNPFAVEASIFLSFGAMFGGIVSFLLAAVAGGKKIWFGRWKKEGRVLNLKWSNFKKYLSDFTLLKEHPPSSVKLWDYYMSYAVAFGVAEKTLKAMKVSVPERELRTSRLYPLYHQPVYFSTMRSSFIPSYSPPSRSSGGYGSIGGFGGGFGGGGGGAR